MGCSDIKYIVQFQTSPLLKNCVEKDCVSSSSVLESIPTSVHCRTTEGGGGVQGSEIIKKKQKEK